MPSTRRDRHDLVSASLAARTHDELAALVQAGPASTVGVGGGSSVLDVEGIAVFAKRVPITDRELAHPHSTANLFRLPTFCQYGMGRPPVAPEQRDIDAVVAQFGGEPAVRSRLEELARADASLVLFLEHIPDQLIDRLTATVESTETFERQLFAAVDFLRHREILHMDGHVANMRADADRIYLVDFGLATSPRFDLSDAEREFVAGHVDHDADYAAMRLVNWLVTTACGVPTSVGPAERNAYVRRCANGHIPRDVPDAVARMLARHAPAAAEMNDFCWRLFDGDIHARYPGGTVGILPRSSGTGLEH